MENIERIPDAVLVAEPEQPHCPGCDRPIVFVGPDRRCLLCGAALFKGETF